MNADGHALMESARAQAEAARQRSGVGLRSPAADERAGDVDAERRELVEHLDTQAGGVSAEVQDERPPRDVAHFAPELAQRVQELRALELSSREELQLAFVERMLGFAETREAGRARILKRAQMRLAQLESGLASALCATRAPLNHSLRQAQFPPPATTQSSVSLRAPVAPPAGTSDEDVVVHERLTSRLSERGSMAPMSRAPDALALAEQLYNARVGTVRMDKAAATFDEGLPPEAGPYHSTTVASDAFKALHAQAPELLRAWLQRIENLTVALELSDDSDHD